MIFNTLLRHANALAKENLLEEDCFILDRCFFGIEEFKELFEQNRMQDKPKTKLDLPVIFIGKIEKIIPGRFQRNNPANVAKDTFQKIKKKEDFPPEWFPWKFSKNKMSISDFVLFLKKFNDTSPENIYELFTSNGPLFTFTSVKNRPIDHEASNFEDMVANAVYQVVTCNKPTLAVHSVLALNALNERAGLIGEKRDPSLIRKELFKFCLLFWMLYRMQSLKILASEMIKAIRVEPKITVSGNTGDLSRLPILLDAGCFVLGVHTAKMASSHPIVDKFLSLTREDSSSCDRISLTRANKVFTAPKTGKAPTNAFKLRGKSVLSPKIMLGVDRTAIDRILPAYSKLIQDKAFSLSRTALTYYVFPENVSLTERYLEYLTNMISQLNTLKQDYFNWLRKGGSTSKAKDKKKEALARSQAKRRALWEKSWSRFRLGELLFAFEENVGSGNQPQFAWTTVYRQLPAAKAFLFLEMVDNPAGFGRLLIMLDHTAQNFGGWKEKEVKRLFDRHFTSGKIDQVECWIRWRKYLSRNNSSEKPIDPKLWEHSMGLIIQIKAMNTLAVETAWTGKALLNHLAMRRKTMDQDNRSNIQNYLKELFLPGTTVNTPEKNKKGADKILGLIEQQAKNYAIFVDTESDSWQSIVEGLVCGWALKQICRKIRKDDYKSVIGGKSLAKHTPAQLRTLSIDLLSKAERGGATPWNVQAPLEQMFKWSQKNPHTPEVVLFMDAVSLGFMRYDSPSETATSDEINANETQNQGGVQ